MKGCWRVLDKFFGSYEGLLEGRFRSCWQL